MGEWVLNMPRTYEEIIEALKQPIVLFKSDGSTIILSPFIIEYHTDGVLQPRRISEATEKAIKKRKELIWIQ